MTNLITAITLSVLVTNISLEYPQRLVPEPCPSGIVGCAVFHGKYVPEDNPQTRERIEREELLEITTIPQLGLSVTNSRRIILESRFPEKLKRVETWVSAADKLAPGPVITGANPSLFTPTPNGEVLILTNFPNGTSVIVTNRDLINQRMLDMQRLRLP